MRLARGGEEGRLRRVTRSAMLLSGTFGVLVLIAVQVWPERALALMGEEFGVAASYLRIMALAQFATALLGPLSVLLNM